MASICLASPRRFVATLTIMSPREMSTSSSSSSVTERSLPACGRERSSRRMSRTRVVRPEGRTCTSSPIAISPDSMRPM
jgi:hypothetical protein